MNIQRSWMLFVDGENLTMQAQAILEKRNRILEEHRRYKKDVFIWHYQYHALQSTVGGYSYIAANAIRAYYYTCFSCSDEAKRDVESRLWDIGFTPRVFRKARRDQKAKGVDISLTTDMLTHAFLDHYDVAVLVTGDQDYAPLIREVKRFGKRVVVNFFDERTPEDLRLEADEWFDLTDPLFSSWFNTPFCRPRSPDALK